VEFCHHPHGFSGPSGRRTLPRGDRATATLQPIGNLTTSFIEDALTEGGFEPAIAASGEEAVTLLNGGAVIKNSAARYRALVTDINLKGKLDGWRVAKKAREIDPAFPIVYVTVAAADDWASKACLTAFC
jgi:CheY-like chemotaxis protein